MTVAAATRPSPTKRIDPTQPGAPAKAEEAKSGGETPATGSTAKDTKIDAAIQTATRQLANVLAEMVADTIAQELSSPAKAAAKEVSTGLGAKGASDRPAMKFGDRGPQVSALQKALNATGASLNVDGIFGAQTQAAVQAQQRKRGEAPTGLASGALQEALALPKQAPLSTSTAEGRATGPFARSPSARARQAEALLQQNGVSLQEGKSYVVQIDQDIPPASASAAQKSAYLRSYTGETSVFQARGGKLVETAGPFKSAAHPGQKGTRRRSFTDINRDGRDDIAHLRSGAFEYNMNTTSRGRFNPKSDRAMKVARDLNQDGTISNREDQYAKDRDLNATAIQWHKGLASRPSSVGCQTMSPSDFAKFSRAVKKGQGNSFTYVLARRPNDRFGANPL